MALLFLWPVFRDYESEYWIEQKESKMAAKESNLQDLVFGVAGQE
jgi:hypothetical protein